MKRKPIDQQVVVVMGASSGIGREETLDAYPRRIPRSLYNWLETHRATRWALMAGTMLGTLAAIGRRPGRGHASG